MMVSWWASSHIALFAAPPNNPIPMMAYYYIWFDDFSWDRVKSDYPLLGRYNSDDEQVMRQHIQWAQTAGIDGFIVSWKSSYNLDRRLEKLMRIAQEEQFRLWIIYQGLDFERQPQPIDHVSADFDYFIENYADHSAFQPQPILIWSGTWEFTVTEIAEITAFYRPQLTILASERSTEGYLRVADLVDGNAYYWSSGDPIETPGYQKRLQEMAEAVRENAGMWVAPVTPGFDARLLGGSRVIERRDGETLRASWSIATSTMPDAIGLISWNEFSENSHIEPSQNYGSVILETISDIQHAPVPIIPDIDSSTPGDTDSTNTYSLRILGMTFLTIFISFAVVVKRSK